MENFDRFWHLLPKKDADIYFELRNYLDNPGCETDIARLFKTSTHRYILSNLQENPYPMCQIVRCFPPSIYMHLYYEALQQFIELSPDQMYANKFNLYSFLINAHMSDKWLEKCQAHIFDAIFRQIDTDDYWELPLVLLASKSMPLTKAYKAYLSQSYETNPCTKRNAFFMATNRSIHFFEPIIQGSREMVEPDFISSAARLVKLAILISNKPIRARSDFNFYEEVWKQFEEIQPAKLSDNQKIFYNEIARMLALHDFVRTNRRYEYLSDCIAIKILASKYNILDFFVKFNEGCFIMNTSDYHLVRRQLVENRIFNQSVNPNIPKHSEKPSEVNLYDQFYTIYLMVEVLLIKHTARNYEEVIRVKSGEIKKIIDNIDDSRAYIETVEFLFMLLFLRWEHVNSRVFSNGRLELSTTTSVTHESDSSMEFTDNASSRKVQVASIKSGFTGSFTVVKYMLDALSSSVVNRKVDEQNEGIRRRFMRISSAIGDAKWRLQLVDLYYVVTNCIRVPSDLKLLLTSRQNEMCSRMIIPQTSSDENDSKAATDGTRRESVIRRKPRRQKSAKKSKPERSDSFAHSTEVEGRNSTNISFEIGNISAIRHGNNRERRRFMAKMLGQFTDMVAISVMRGDLNGARNIIEEHNLEESAIASEVQLLKSFNELKNQLKESLKALPNTPNVANTDHSMEDTKKLIVHGFESSQILLNLEQFILKRPVPETPETMQLLDRFVTNYSYLELYRGFSLQGVIIVDYALSFLSHLTTCMSVVKMLPVLWDKEEPIDPWQNRLGYYGFVGQIITALTLYNAKCDQSLTIQQLLSTQLYTFNASQLTRKLQQEDTFRKQKQVTLSTLSERPGLIENIINFEVYSQKNENLLQHVFAYSMYMNRLIHFKDPAKIDIDRTCLGELLEIDLFSLIGDIMFDESKNVSLRDIEAIVCNLNTNLLHVITKNTCPIISVCEKFNPNLGNELHRMLESLKDETIESDQTKNKSRKPFKIKRQDVIDYVRQHNQLIAYLLTEIHHIQTPEPPAKPKKQLNCDFLNNIMEMEELSVRAASNERGDQMVAALNFDSFNLEFARQLILQQKYREALRFFQFSQERHLKRHQQVVRSIKDVLITKILEGEHEDDLATLSLIENIKDLQLMSSTLLKYINRISDEELASHLIRNILLSNRVNEVPIEEIEQLKKYLSDITLYAHIGRATTMTDLLPYDAWTKVMDISRVAPDRLLKSLIERNQFELCYHWIQTVSLQEIEIKSQFIDLFMSKIEENRNNDEESFINVCKVILKIIVQQMDFSFLLKLRNRTLLQYLLDFLIENSTSENHIYNNYKITLSIFDIISFKDADTLWDLAETPLLIIEQYILNSKFETLSRILQTIRPLVKGNECTICANLPKWDASFIGDLSLSHSFFVDYKDHATSIECIDQILRTYAAKALDFRIGSGKMISEMGQKSLNKANSMDSLCKTFIMPRETPDKSNWIKDDETTHCMCCKRSVFTMLTRRHHCRRCGRVVCHSCSTKRLLIPKLYENVMVRVCDDCHKQTNEAQTSKTENIPSPTVEKSPPPPSMPLLSSSIAAILETNEQPIGTRIGWMYRFTGDLKHDSLLREEFSFEYPPSASLCLNLISMHTPGQNCCNFLLSYCKKFEALLKPLKPGQSNPEVDYAFVTRILYCLSFAAKVHGSTSDCVKIRDHAEIINAVVRNGCESILPLESINMKSLRALRDNLVVAEKFPLAIEISLKSGLQKTGIMAAWGIACIKAGCFETAREKFLHCLIRTTCDQDSRQIIHFLTTDDQTKAQSKTFNFKSTNRSAKVQPLLSEILSILETTCHPVDSNVLHKVSTMSVSNRSLLSIKFSKKEKLPIHEPAVNILHTLSNLKHISQGKYSVKTHQTLGLTGVENMNSLFASDNEQHGLQSRFYTESIYYLVSYGRHIDVLRFLIKYKQVTKALKYVLHLHIPADQFIQTIIIPYLKSGRLNVIIQQMIDMDATLVMWKEYIVQICLMLEKRNLLNSLYQVQLLLKDTIRASMTCVRFYAADCATYQDLRNNAHHLMNAQQHLKSELELCQWEEIKNLSKRTEENHSIVMKMDQKSLNQHINTIWLQIDASKFLATCEENGKETVSLIPKISLLTCKRIPTLFESTQDKIVLVALILICGVNVEEGFGLAYRIIQDMALNSDKIYAIATKYLALNNRLIDVEKLVNCIKSNSGYSETKLCNEILSLAVQNALNHNSPQRTKAAIENLIRLITDVSIQIDCHILSGQLKSAYLLAVQHKRVPDIRRILRYADKTNQTQIKKLCEKKLQSIDGQEGHSSEQ